MDNRYANMRRGGNGTTRRVNYQTGAGRNGIYGASGTGRTGDNTSCGCGASAASRIQSNRSNNTVTDSNGNVRCGCEADENRLCGMEQRVYESAATPVGMGYIPWQMWDETYEACKALEVGTIFPELDLPFEMRRC